jgi:hypothetical protein
MATRPFLKEASARTLVAGDLQAVFLPDHGMLGASLRYKGVKSNFRLPAASCRLPTVDCQPPTEISIYI